MDYWHVNGRFYGRGIPEMLINPQSVINEVVNQRLDEGAQSLNKRFAVVEKAFVDPKDITEGGPGIHVRINQKALGPNGDVKQVISEIGQTPMDRGAGFAEVLEWERQAQERSSANRVTLGTSGLSGDVNKTLGGQELLKQQAGEKFAYIAMVQEFTFQYELFRSYWKLIYANINQEDIVLALGQERAAKFILLPPEEVERDYVFEPQGLFEMENKGIYQARIAALQQQFGMFPWFNHLAAFDQEARSANLDPDSLKFPESEAINIMGQAQMMAKQIASQMLANGPQNAQNGPQAQPNAQNGQGPSQ
jgi:hypothetical protein